MYLFSALLSVVVSFVSVYMYTYHYDGDVVIDSDTLKNVLASLYTVWFISGLSFAVVIKREYLRSFYTLDTTWDYCKNTFLHLREDREEERAALFNDHPDTQKGWGDEILQPWTLSNWERWEKEKPAWFTDAWIGCVPNEYIPYEWRVKYKKTKGRVDDADLKRQRGSISMKELLGGTEEK